MKEFTQILLLAIKEYFRDNSNTWKDAWYWAYSLVKGFKK